MFTEMHMAATGELKQLESLQPLWDLIGEEGRFLTLSEKGQIVQFLAVAGSVMPGSNLGEVYESFPDDFEIEPFNGCPSLKDKDWEDIHAALSLICLSPPDCWLAITKLAVSQLEGYRANLS